MLKQLLILTLLLHCIIAMAQYSNPVLPDSIAKRAKVKTVTIVTNEDTINLEVETYNTDGNLIETHYIGRGDTMNSVYYYYNDKKQLIKDSSTFDDGDVDYTGYIYRADGRLVQKVAYLNGKPTGTDQWIYFTKSRRITGAQHYIKSITGNVGDVYDYLYNKKGDIVEYAYDNERIVSKYKKGLVVKQEHFSGDKLVGTTEYVYSPAKKLRQELYCNYYEHDKKSKSNVSTYYYNSAGLLESLVKGNGTLIISKRKVKYGSTYTYTFY